MTEPLRIGVVGAGLIGGWHAQRWRQMPVELVGFVSRRLESAQDAAGRYGGRAFESLDQLLAEVDVVDVCTPTPVHKEIVLAAAEAGKQIVCEKPLARSLRDAQEIVDRCRAANIRLFVAQVVRFFPEFAKAKQLLDEGAIGKPGVIRTTRGAAHPHKSERNWYADFAQSGGAILDMGVHDLDYARWCCGNVERVYAEGLTFAGIPLTDYALVTLRFANGAVGHVESSWAWPRGTFRTSVEIAGDGGLLEFDNATTVPLRVARKQADDTSAPGVALPESPLAPEDDPYYAELNHFVECIQNDTEFLVQPEDALEAVRIALAALHSMRTGKPVTLADFKEADV